MAEQPLNVLGIAGSLRRQSYNKFALRAAQQLAPASMRIDVFDLAPIPLFNQDDESAPPPGVVEFKRGIRDADAILIATPEYNYSIPGVLKNAMDWASRPFGENAWKGKPVAVMGASPGAFGTVRAQYHLRQTFITLDMPVVTVPEVMIGHAAKAFDEAGNLVDEKAQELIRKLLDRLIALARR